MGARANASSRLLRRDKDAYDRHCDHLLVIDTSQGHQTIVGTYRLMLQSHASRAGGFYSQSEFDLTPLFKSNPKARFLELGRSCIAPAYRDRRTIELLWHGTWCYALAQGIEILFGCASFDGVDPNRFAPALSWLGKNASLDGNENCCASSTNGVPLSSFQAEPASLRQAMSAMPPLIKGYLRVGAKIGSQAVIDYQFGTTDVLVVLKVDQINPRYLAHFGEDASRFAA